MKWTTLMLHGATNGTHSLNLVNLKYLLLHLYGSHTVMFSLSQNSILHWNYNPQVASIQQWTDFACDCSLGPYGRKMRASIQVHKVWSRNTQCNISICFLFFPPLHLHECMKTLEAYFWLNTMCMLTFKHISLNWVGLNTENSPLDIPRKPNTILGKLWAYWVQFHPRQNWKWDSVSWCACTLCILRRSNSTSL